MSGLSDLKGDLPKYYDKMIDGGGNPILSKGKKAISLFSGFAAIASIAAPLFALFKRKQSTEAGDNSGQGATHQ